MSTPDLLAAIVAATRRAVEHRETTTPLRLLESRQRRTPMGGRFIAALRDSPAPRIIAECKRRSPSRGILRAHYDPASHAASYATGGAAAISVLTEPTFFDGALEHLAIVRSAVDLPLLRKDFIVSRYQLVEAAAYGADAILLIAGALDATDLRALVGAAGELGLAVLVEVHDREELQRALDAGAAIVGVNSRNLRTLDVNLRVLEALSSSMPADLTAVAESGIREAADVARLADLGYHAFLVGERLITQPDPGRALSELRAGAVDRQPS